jgi:hypothetical protein
MGMPAPQPDPATSVAPLLPRATAFDPWNYRVDAGWSAEHDLIGYHVKATDGNVGKVDLDCHVRDESYLVVDTGPWIFSASVVVPAGTVTLIDHAGASVYLDRAKDEVTSGPEFEPGADGLFADQAYRDKLEAYYLGSQQH